ncbi:Bug family tripartite tricarboxylate transporter substrate binding protein [Falsiroseomonas oryzae]|uniref:Bug family tripartite tricarboxylate transporter substrate binding protein n=1 Tax=Falsiroseomonas oryzae TaxID=2766473 RepID=UPI0022EB265A|nr:tripartite tricarboxylate transporter substrate binding protein [Roseomonas sp. MO-31]
MIQRRTLGLGMLGAAATGLVARPALAAYPDRVITIIVPFAAGGATDLAGRLLAERLGPYLAEGGRAVVENRPGAGSALGADVVRRARPDGYTLLVGSASTLAVAPASGAAAARYHPTQDFTPLAFFGISTMGLLVSRDAGITTVSQLLDRLRANPGRFSFASSGVGGIAHLASEYFCKAAGVEAVHVPYRGGSQTAEAIMKGETLFAIDTVGSNIGQVRDGSLRLLAVTTRDRDPNFPDVPTIAEAGVRGFEIASWTVLAGPAGMPPDIVEAIGRAAARAIAEPTMRNRLESTGTVPELNSTPAATRAFLDRQFELYREVVQRVGLRLD